MWLAGLAGGVLVVAAAVLAAVILTLPSGKRGTTGVSGVPPRHPAPASSSAGPVAAAGMMLVRLDTPGSAKCSSVLARTNPNADDPKPLNLPGQNCDKLPQYSRDHKWISFTRDNGASGHAELWEMWSDGTHARKVTDRIRAGTRSAWAPDDKQLAFTGDVSPSQIFVADLSTGDVRQLTTDPAGATSISWSPDGKHLAFSSGKSGTSQIYTLDVDDPAHWTQLTRVPDRAVNASWSRDGRQIAFTYGPSGSTQIYLMNADGSNQHALTNGHNDQDPCWNPAGTEIAFARGRGPARRSGRFARPAAACGG